ncbi:unnamed protein product [Prunus armeniaca]
MSYYWPTMVKDCMDYVKKCQACQFHANFIHQSPEPLHPTITSWPFDAWGLDVVGSIAPKSSDDSHKLLFKMGRGYTPKKSKERKCSELYQSKHHSSVWCAALYYQRQWKAIFELVNG